MTEEQAKTKECPQHLIMMTMIQIAAGENGASEKSITDAAEFGYCTASDCMMWKWNTSPEQAARLNALGNKEAECDGYCGLVK
jgi:hypothetical protein